MSDKKEYLYTVDTSMLDSRAVITVEGYQRIIITTTEKELERINMSVATLMKKWGVSWVLLSLSIKVIKQIKPNEELRVTTWHTWKKGVIYRRDFLICDKNGEALAYATSFSSLFDIEKRRICMDRKVYEAISLDEGEELFPAQSRYEAKGDFEFVEEVVARPSWIDSLGHVNNFKYGQIAFDNIPLELAEKSDKISEIEMFFTGELRLGDGVKISRLQSENLLEIAGTHSEGEKQAFLVRLHYNG